mgnify:CR=1 FL=1
MSITIGVFDFFSYAIPGSLYLLTAIYLVSIFSGSTVNIQSITLTGELIVVFGVGGYITGVLFDLIARTIWDWIFKDDQVKVKALADFKKRSEKVKVRFGAEDWPVLLAYIKHNSPENVFIIEKDKALSMMLRNVSVCCFSLFVGQSIFLFLNGLIYWQLSISVAALIFSILSARQSFRFDRWFFLGIYETAISLGPEMINLIGEKREKLSTKNRFCRRS